MRAEQLETLMMELGPVLDPLGVVALPDAEAWGIAIDEDSSILVDLVEDGSKIVLSCEVGRPFEGDRGPLHELMLRHNYHWDRTGGVRLALDGVDGGVVQIIDLAADGLDVPQLAKAIRSFAEAAQAWREIVCRPKPPEVPTTDDPSLMLLRV